VNLPAARRSPPCANSRKNQPMMRTTKPFAHIIQALRAANKNRDAVDLDDDESQGEDDDSDDVEHKPKKTKKKSKPAIEDQSDEGDEPKDDGEDSEERKPKSLTPAQATALAQQICLAGAKRRGEVVIENPSPIVSEAARHAGRSTYVTPVENPERLAAAIVAAGKRRRGEAA
jgi:hypothetical protein